MSKAELSGPGIPSPERRAKGPVACIECFQQIPCNPCEEACPKGAITVGAEITGLPYLDAEKCNGCGICMTRCPGLSIFSLHENYSETSALVGFPYEYVPLPQKGQKVCCTDRSGDYVTDGLIHRVTVSSAFDHTAIVTVEIPKEFVMDVRFIKRLTPEDEDADCGECTAAGKSTCADAYVEPTDDIAADEDNIYVCRCEEVTVGDIKRAIARGADSLRAIKLHTHAGMGVCQGMTCRKNIERMLREQKVDIDLCHGHSQRFPVRMLNVGDLSHLTEEDREEDGYDH